MEQSNTPTPNAKKSKIIIAAVVATLVIALFFFFNSQQQQIDANILTIEQAKVKSDSLYNEMKEELAFYKQDNQELYKQLLTKEEQLEKLYVKINRLIGQAERDKAAKKQITDKLATLSSEIAELRVFVEAQTKNMEELRLENQRLKAQKDSLQNQVVKKNKQTKSLQNSSDALEEENKILADKVEAASVLQIVNIKAVGLRTKNNGTRVGIDVARRTEIVDVCFEIVPNTITPVGVNRLYLRLIDPAGFTVQDRNRGSGRITTIDEERIDYTISKTFDYDPNLFSLCMEWSSYPSTPFTSGRYQIELYNKSRLVGTAFFNTK